MTIDKWTCIGPYANIGDATALKGISEYDGIRRYNRTTIILGDGYLPDKLEIKRSLVKMTYPVITIRKPLEESK